MSIKIPQSQRFRNFDQKLKIPLKISDLFYYKIRIKGILDYIYYEIWLFMRREETIPLVLDIGNDNFS